MKSTLSKMDPGLGASNEGHTINQAIATAIEVTASTDHNIIGATDAAALIKLRDRLRVAGGNKRTLPNDWQIDDVMEILTALQAFIEASLNEVEEASENLSIVNVHWAASTLAAFIRALGDLETGLTDPRLKKKRPAGGRSLKSSDREKIALALTMVEVHKRSKKITLPEARKRVAKILKTRAVRVVGKEMTPARLAEWAKDFDLQGRKRKGT